MVLVKLNVYFKECYVLPNKIMKLLNQGLCMSHINRRDVGINSYLSKFYNLIRDRKGESLIEHVGLGSQFYEVKGYLSSVTKLG